MVGRGGKFGRGLCPASLSCGCYGGTGWKVQAGGALSRLAHQRPLLPHSQSNKTVVRLNLSGNDFTAVGAHQRPLLPHS